MRIGIVSTAVPLILGGYRFIVEWLHEKLVERGHEVEIIYIPFTEEEGHILPQMTALRMMKLDEYFDRVITFRPPAHVVQHPRKVVWFIHHLRMFYDLWDTPYRPFPINAATEALRAAVVTSDTRALTEAHRVFTNSRVVGQRIKTFNGLDSEILYPPVLHPEMFRSGEYGEEIVSVCRMEHHKRQHLLVEALGMTRSRVRLRLCGATSNPAYVWEMLDMARRMGVADRLIIEDRWISEEEKIGWLENALASVYAPFDEDSYGYPTLEAAHAQRCTVTTTDSGGVPEFVEHGINGLIAEPDAPSLATAFDRLHEDRIMASRMGAAAERRVAELGIDWDTVVARLLA